MKRRDALKALTGLAATSALGGLAKASQQSSGDDIPLPDLIRKIGPMMDSIPIKVEKPRRRAVVDHRAGREHHRLDRP